MTQPKFMWATMAVKPIGGIKQYAAGKTICDLNNDIQITHNASKHDLMILIFKEDQKRYKIPSDKELGEILEMYMTLKNLNQKLREYAETNLEVI